MKEKKNRMVKEMMETTLIHTGADMFWANKNWRQVLTHEQFLTAHQI